MAGEIVNALIKQKNERFDETSMQSAILRADLATRDKRIADLKDQNATLRRDIFAL